MDRSCMYVSRRQQHGDRSARQWDDYRWDERREPRRETPQDPYHKYGGDAPRCSERTSRGREYSDSPKTLHGRDPAARERLRKSPARRRASSPEWSVSEKKRRRFAEDDKDNYRYRREPEDKVYRQSPPDADEDFKHRKTPQDSRNRHRRDEFTYKQQHEDSTYRRTSGYYKDRDGHERSRGRSQEHNTKSFTKTRERNDSPSTDQKDYRLNGTRFPLNGYSGQSSEYDAANQTPAVPEEKSANGFQRFLDVLNKGVNVDVLTKIVTQTPAGAGCRPCPSPSFQGAADPPWSPGQQGHQQYGQEWGGGEEPLRPASPRGGSSSGSGSPGAAEKPAPMTPEDEHKHRQMQDVLQAIGLDLGFEELGRMSHRIRERLYGKRDGDSSRHRKESWEREARAAASPKPQGRPSPSSRSSFSPLTQDRPVVDDSYGDAAFQTFPTDAEAAAAVAYSPPQLLYPSLPPPPPPPPPALPPNSPCVSPGFFLPPFLPYPCLPPLNLLPAALVQTPHPGLQPPPNLANVNPLQAVNGSALKSKTLSRPRCLQVIDTKQPG